MSASGYYRFPAIYGDRIVFVSEDDLWEVPAAGGVARRLTANLGAVANPHFSPDGKTIAFTGREEGNPEVYVMPAEGGPVRRVTYLGCNSTVLGWTPCGSYILFSTDYGQPRDRIGYVHAIRPEGGMHEPWPVGPAVSIWVHCGRATVLGRNNNDPARWKRYRGGTAGDLWIDREGNGVFERLIQLKGNLARPMWIGERVYFISDHEGIANLYSCTPKGEDLKRHTHHSDYFVRFPNSDGKRIVYHSGADLYVYDIESDRYEKVNVEYTGSRAQRQRKFVDAAKYLETYDLHPEGHSLAINARGKSFVMGNWEGAVVSQGHPDAPARYRLTRWLNDGKRVLTVTDEGGDYALDIHDTKNGECKRIEGLDIGRPAEVRISPTADHALLANHRNELVFVDLEAGTCARVDASQARPIQGFCWSPDGRWAAYGLPLDNYVTAIKLWNRETGDTHFATEPVLHDVEPAFDPEGKYLYFLGMRVLNPVYDNLHFDLGFPKGMKPYVITLKADARSPFLPEPRPLEPAKPETSPAEEGEKKEEGPKPVEIDLDGITNRVLAFPVAEGIYQRIAGIPGKVLFTSVQPMGALDIPWPETEPSARATLEMFDFDTQKVEPLVQGMSGFTLSRDSKTMAYQAGARLRVVKAGAKPDEKMEKEEPGRLSGWVNLTRIKLSVVPPVEWKQMAREAWRLQREHFWTEDMSQIEWDAVWDRYSPLIDRVSTRGEFSDLVWEMQGELGTSHAYEFGGDYRPEPTYPQGFLGADIAFDGTHYRFTSILPGAPGEDQCSSPLLAPGVNVSVGDALLAVNGRPLSKDFSPYQALVHQAESEVVLTIEGTDGARRDVTVKALKGEFKLRYREWVEANRRYVHEKTGGRVGYVHIPDMGPQGYAEFHRLFLAEVAREAMIVDVRYNRGGHVSCLLLEKLARKRIGYDVSRWGQPEPYPPFSVAGPMVALTNQWAGSDGDIVSHAWKLMGLGPLIGKRTWGGVIGIWPRNMLADGTITSQPEYSFWFFDVGWGVENYGTDPDVDIDITPQDYVAGRDPQMEKAIEMVQELLAKEPPPKPDFSKRPNLALPKLIQP